MNKIILTNGLIAGAIVSLMFLISHPFVDDGTISMTNGMLVGYTSMVIALSVIFFAVRTYRDRHLAGKISFGRGFKIGILITLVAAVMYCLTWEVYYNVAASDFIEKWNAYEIGEMQKAGASSTEIENAKADQAKFAQLYKNPVVRFGFTMMEILPVGLIISLVSAGLLRKKEFLPENVEVNR